MIEVLVVGAGPVGLLLGCELARRGVDVRVIDRRAGVGGTGGRGRGLVPRTLEIADDLGVVDQFYARGRRNPRSRVHRRGGVVEDFDPAADPAAWPTPDAPHRCFAVELPQQVTEEILAGRLASLGVQVERGSELTGLDVHPGHAVVTVGTGGELRQVRARYVVGCDGGSSTVRKEAGIAFVGETWDEEHYLTGCVELAGLDPDLLHVWPDADGGVVALTWQRELDRWVFFVRVHPGADGGLPQPTGTTLQRIFDDRCGLPGVRFGATSAASTWRPNIRMAQRYRSGPVLLAGDAAHVHSPAGGQGMNTGLLDAYNLGWKLAHVLRGAPAGLLDTYEAERMPVAGHLLATTSERHRAYYHGSSGGAAIADTLAATDTFSDTTQLSLSYRGGPLSRDLDGTAALPAGDRAPDAPCRRAGDGASVRLFDVFRGTHLTLLQFGADPLPHTSVPDGVRVVTVVRPGERVPAGDALVDESGHAHRAYGVNGPVAALVRPDGHIGLAGSPGPGLAPGLSAYLGRVLPPR